MNGFNKDNKDFKLCIITYPVCLQRHIESSACLGYFFLYGYAFKEEYGTSAFFSSSLSIPSM